MLQFKLNMLIILMCQGIFLLILKLWFPVACHINISVPTRFDIKGNSFHCLLITEDASLLFSLFPKQTDLGTLKTYSLLSNN